MNPDCSGGVGGMGRRGTFTSWAIVIVEEREQKIKQ